MYRVYTKQIEERNPIPPTQEKEPRGQHYDQWQNVQHKVDEGVARSVLFMYQEHLSRVVPEIPHAVHVKEHHHHWRPLAEPSEKPQRPPRIPVACVHQRIQHLTGVPASQQLHYLFLFFFCHSRCFM